MDQARAQAVAENILTELVNMGVASIADDDDGHDVLMVIINILVKE